MQQFFLGIEIGMAIGRIILTVIDEISKEME